MPQDPADLQRALEAAFLALETDLEGIHRLVDTPPTTQPLTAVAGTIMAKAGDVFRLLPGAAGIQVLLPTARAANKGEDVSIIVIGTAGTVTVRAVEGLVQKTASVTLTGDGLRVFRSDGGDGTATGAGGWWIVGRNSADASYQIAALSAGTQSGSTGTFVFSNSGNVTFGMSGSSVITASATVAATRELGLISHVGGNVVSSASRLAFSNASGVTWSLSTAASAATVLASVNDQSVGFISNGGSNAVSSVSRIVFTSNGNFAWSLITAANAATIRGDVTAVALAAGTQQANTGTVVFDNSNGITFGMSGFSQVTASYARELGLVSHVGGNVVSSVTRLAFSNASNVTWSLSTAANAVTVLASIASDSNIGLVSHIGGNSVSNVTRLAFSNASNVTWSLSTAASAVTVIASVAAGGGGGPSIAASGSTQSDSTVNFARATVLDGGMASASINNVAFAFGTGASSTNIQATALMRVTANLTTSGGFPVSKINFVDGGGVSWGVATSNDAEGRAVNITASVAAAGADPTISYHQGASGRDWGNIVIDAGNSFNYVFPINGANPFPGNMTISTMDVLVQGSSISTTNGTGSWGFTLQGGLYSLNNSTRLSLINSFSFGTSSTTHASSQSASYNSSYQGQKWITIHSSLWSAQPVLSAGVPYWFAWRPMRVGASAIISAFGNQIQGINFHGTIGVATNTISGRMFPFVGVMASAGVPVSIANTHIATTRSDSNVVGLYNFRGDIAQ